jgi:hypothetical protein
VDETFLQRTGVHGLGHRAIYCWKRWQRIAVLAPGTPVPTTA